MKTVLVVEDERTYARIITNWLIKNGMNARYVLSISAAKEFVLGQKIDLILSDFNLPGGNWSYLAGCVQMAIEYHSLL